jgi:hypothetical protein
MLSSNIGIKIIKKKIYIKKKNKMELNKFINILIIQDWVVSL